MLPTKIHKFFVVIFITAAFFSVKKNLCVNYSRKVVITLGPGLNSLYKLLKFLNLNFFSGASVSVLREHHHVGSGHCSDSSLDPENLDSHKVEKRSYLPPVTCSPPHEQGAIKSKIHCQPRPRVVRLPWPNDTSVHQVRSTNCR